MKFSYSEFEGQGFLSPDQLFAQPNVMNFILQYGEQALDAMQNLDNDEEQEFIQSMIDAGLLEEYEDEDGNTKLRMTGRMVRGFQHRALLDIFADMKKGSRDGHQTRHQGRTTERADGTKAYEFGDPISELELGQTLRNAIARQNRERAASVGGSPGGGGISGGARLPIGINSGDFELHMTEGSADCATVMLIDLSGSMMRYGRFIQAKRIALGMQELIRGR
ncbi:MAG: hypothetical protein AAGL98_10000, partial [Planctomycetota bacterium]